MSQYPDYKYQPRFQGMPTPPHENTKSGRSRIASMHDPVVYHTPGTYRMHAQELPSPIGRPSRQLSHPLLPNVPSFDRVDGNSPSEKRLGLGLLDQSSFGSPTAQHAPFRYYGSLEQHSARSYESLSPPQNVQQHNSGGGSLGSIVQQQQQQLKSFSAVCASNTEPQNQPVVQLFKDRPIICVSNIPWDLTTKEVKIWLEPFRIVEFGIHLLMDRNTDELLGKAATKSLGKTLADAFIELETERDAQTIISLYNKSHLKNREVTVTKARIEDLMLHLFPTWGPFDKSIAPEDEASKRLYLTRDEITAIVSVCKNYKLHFSRKCADRSFENIMSVIKTIPWQHAQYSPGVMHRDHIFEMLKVSIDALRVHLSKDYYHVSKDLLPRMIYCGVKCPGFTERQKLVLLQSASMECPEELVPYLTRSAGSVTEGPKQIISVDGGDLSGSFSALKIDFTPPPPQTEDTRNLEYYQQELARWQQKYEALEDKYLQAVATINRLTER